MKKMRKKDQEQFKTYYERKKLRKHSLFGAAREAYIFGISMLAGLFPVVAFVVNMDKLGPLWWIFLLSYSALMSMVIYAVYRYREIVGIRGYFTDEEFNRVFRKELWLIRFMDRFSRFLVH